VTKQIFYISNSQSSLFVIPWIYFYHVRVFLREVFRVELFLFPIPISAENSPNSLNMVPVNLFVANGPSLLPKVLELITQAIKPGFWLLIAVAEPLEPPILQFLVGRSFKPGS
jgi:hypothetical protein